MPKSSHHEVAIVDQMRELVHDVFGILTWGVLCGAVVQAGANHLSEALVTGSLAEN